MDNLFWFFMCTVMFAVGIAAGFDAGLRWDDDADDATETDDGQPDFERMYYDLCELKCKIRQMEGEL